MGLSFGLLIAILLATAYLALDRTLRIYANLEEELTENLLKLQLGQEALRYSSENSRITMQIFLVQRPEVIVQLLVRRAENTRKISALMRLVEARRASDEEKQLLQTVKETRTVYVDSYQQVLRLLLAEKSRSAAAEIMVQQTTPAFFRYHAAWDEFARFQFDEIERINDRGKKQHAITRRIMLVLEIMVALLAGGIAIVATHQVARVVNSRIRMQQEVYKLNAKLEQRVTQRTQELQHTENQLRTSLGELQVYSGRVETVNKLVELLQSCLTLEEAYKQASHVLQRFFPEGALLMLNPSRNLLDVAGQLGKGICSPSPAFFSSKLLGLRKGRTHVVEPGDFSLLCSASSNPASPASHIVFRWWLRASRSGTERRHCRRRITTFSDPGSLQHMQELATSLAEQISLAFANLHAARNLEIPVCPRPSDQFV